VTGAELRALGFAPGADGGLIAPAGATVVLAPIEKRFFELQIVIDGTVVVTAVLAEGALKAARNGGAT
jgi:hypothetical protein